MRSQNTNTGEFVLIPRPKKRRTEITNDLFFSESTNSSTTNTPSLHSLASKWWAEEAQEGSIVRNDENVKRIMRSAGWGFDEAVIDADDEGKVIQKEGTLLTNAKKAVEILKQGGVKSDHWVL